MSYIYLHPVGEVGGGILHYLCARLERIYSYPCRIALSVRVPECGEAPRCGRLEDTDIKSADFCRGCSHKLVDMGYVKPHAPGRD